jgi:hypothetical protein
LNIGITTDSVGGVCAATDTSFFESVPYPAYGAARFEVV